MNWKNILSLSPENLTDVEKDELYNTVTWINIDEEEVNIKKCKALIKVSQEILKYKGEQVETLLHELDELATKQGEDDLKKLESDTDVSKSRRSSSVEYENLEQKYIELKSKYKKQLKQNEKNNLELDKVKAKIKNLERENSQLQQDLQSKTHDGSDSDVSESVKDQNKELIIVVQNKNKQISDLLHDIEDVENENSILRNKLVKLRDELSTATDEITLMTEKLHSADLKLAENFKEIQTLTSENEVLQEQLQSLQEEKNYIEQQMAEFTQEINIRVDQWKETLNQKDLLIQDLKSKQVASSIHSSISSLPHDDMEKTNLSALNKVLMEREKQIIELQTQLKEATDEMKDITKVIQSLKIEKQANSEKIVEITAINKDLKKQLKSAHERSRNLQNEVEYLEKFANSKDADLKDLIKSLRDKGETELSKKLYNINELKTENRQQEKQIMSLVRSCNKLQDRLDEMVKENNILRKKLGITDDEEISYATYTRKPKYSKELHDLKKKLANYEEENLELKSKIQKLNRNLADLSDKLIENSDGVDVVDGDVNISKSCSYYGLTKEETTAIIEENEALRKGMHEILNSINTKKESSVKEIKSETLEKLLRALDVKHISGWYHPAMRLQAELHNLEGINAELREQLRIIRVENETLKSDIKINPESPDDISEGEVIKDRNVKDDVQHKQDPPGQPDKDDDLLNTFTFEHITVTVTDSVETILKKIGEIVNILSTKKIALETHKNAFKTLSRMLSLLAEVYESTKNTYTEEIAAQNRNNLDLQENLEIIEAQIKIITTNQSEDSKISKLQELTKLEIINKRKIKYLENEVNRKDEEKESLTENYIHKEESMKKEISDIELKNYDLMNKIEILKNNYKISIDYDLFNETKNNLFNLTLKHRQLCTDFEKSNEKWEIELKILKETNAKLEQNKLELNNKLIDLLTKLHNFENMNMCVDENIEKLSKKIADCEVKEISERQRADHTNNLYELVREQLHKSEEKLKDFAKYNESILQKNLVLQEQLKDTEIKLAEYIDNNLYKELQVTNNNLLEEITDLKMKVKQCDDNEKIAKEIEHSKTIWTISKEQELLSLKHQIVDLIASSDEKMVIAQLHSDNKYYRLMDLDYNKKMDNVKDELKYYKQKCEELGKLYNGDKEKYRNEELQAKKKISYLENLLLQQKIQYFGCVPIISEEKFIQKLNKINDDKHNAFLNLMKAQKITNDSEILKEQHEYEIRNLLQQQKVLAGDKEEYNKMLSWLQEKKSLQLNELRYKRQSEFKETQLQHLIEKTNIQDKEIIQLEEELLLSHKNFMVSPVTEEIMSIPQSPPRSRTSSIKITKTEETQTLEVPQDTNVSDESKISNLRVELIQARNEVVDKSNTIDHLKSKITEHEVTIGMFKKQIGDKQSQISFYEKHILELQSKNYENKDMYNGAGGDNITVGRNVSQINEEILSLQSLVKTLQENIGAKENSILEYESLLKEDRDKHSLGAARLQEEIKILQKCIIDEKQKSNELEESIKQSRPNRAAIEEYVNQVHSLEKHTADLHTSVSSLEAQLQASRQEAARWRDLANDRLQAMNDLHKNLDEQHKSELSVYKEDSERWREEVTNLKDLISKHRSESGNIGVDIQKIMKEKDNKIHELTVMLRQVKNETRKYDKSPEPNLTPKLIDLESTNEFLQKENESLKKRYEQLLQRERSVRDEVRELKAQLIKKPNILTRPDKTEKQIKEQMQRKINTLEAEVIDLKDTLTEQIALNESHKMRSTEDFEKWKKQKYWQQTTEKLKSKLKEKNDDLKKLQQTSSGYRLLIERLEREKHNLENRIKSIKLTSSVVSNEGTIETLRIENMKLLAENQSLISRLEMSQHHAGGLGAAMLQEKLEAQERKIAILEVSAKSPLEVRAEMERMQNNISSFQKKNLCLEAENLEFRMDLEKSKKEVPHLQEQIQHLESYVEVLKTENAKQLGTETVDRTLDKNVEVKKVSELERTVFVLKRVVEKLQVENKRLQGGKRPYCEKTGTGEKLSRDYHRLKEQYAQSIQKVAQLEQELTICKEKIKSFANKPLSDNITALSDELSEVRLQLEQKSVLLDKVKLLLQRAAIKEKALMEEIVQLKLAK